MVSPVQVQRQSTTQFSRTSSNIDDRAQQNVLQDAEQFLLQRVSFIQADNEDESRDDEKFMRFLENAANGQITVQDLNAFGLDSRSRTEACKAVLFYILNVRQKATVLMQQLKLSQLTSSAQNELIQEVAKLRSKLRQLDNVKKDELVKKLEAKEQECLEYRAKLAKIQPQQILMLEPLNPAKLVEIESEVERKMESLKIQMDSGFKRISGLVQDITLLKTSVRDKIIIPPTIIEPAQSDGGSVRDEQRSVQDVHDTSSHSIPQRRLRQQLEPILNEVEQPSNEDQAFEIQEEEKTDQREIAFENVTPQTSQRQLPPYEEIAYLERLDDEAMTQLASLESQVTQELEALRQIQEANLVDKKQLQLETVRIQSQEQQLRASNKYLEGKLASTLTEKEEQNIKLKSEIVIYKNKIQALKLKMKEAVATFETKKIQEMRQQLADEIALKQLEIEQLQKHLEAKNEGMSALESQIEELKQKITNNDIESQQHAHQQQMLITDLSERLKGIDQTYSQQLSQVDQIREVTQKKLNLEEQERTMNSLKLEFLVNNNRKLQLQKRFLEKTLEKDMKNLATEMRKSEIEMQRDAFIPTSMAQQKLTGMYQVVQESLRYVQEIVQFMNFDLGDQIHGRIQDNNDPEEQMPRRPGEEPTSNKRDIQDQSQTLEDQPSRQGDNRPLDHYFYRNIYEIAEVVLSVLCELYQDSQTQISLDTVHLFTLIQSKTDKGVVQDIYNRFFAQNRINFTQQIARTQNRNQTLEREKAEMRRKLEDLTKDLQKARSQSQRALLNDQNQQVDAQRQAENLYSPTSPPTERTHRTLSPAAVVSALQRFQEKKIIESQQEELSALKARMKEVRLNMQRQISDLQDQLKLSKEHHQADMTKLRIEYGRDLQALHKSHLQKEEELKQSIDVEFQDKYNYLYLEQEQFIKELKQAFENDNENLRKELERCDIVRVEQEREMQKLKKRSNGAAQGGWGTFSLVFEDNPKKHHPIILQNQVHGGPVIQTQSKKIASSGQGSTQDFQSSLSTYDSQSQKSIDEGGPQYNPEGMSIDKLAHFIEVGFLLDSKNFRHLDTYKEKTFDSTVSKYLYEFQDPIDNFRAMTIQNKMRQQLQDNYALFNEINPIYVTLNLGRNVSPFWDESASMEHFKLIRREGFYLAGENYLTVNFLRCEEPVLIIRVVAFDNETNSSYSFDLYFEDLMLFVDGNMKLLDGDNHHDLCQMILHNLTLIRKKVSDSLQGGQSVNSQLDGGDSVEKEEGKTEKESNSYSAKLVQKSTQNQTSSKPKMSESQLAVEHRIFFNEHYRNEYERNKLIIAKNDKRKKGLLQDKFQNTDFQKSIVYEAYDSIYSDVVKLQTHSRLESQMSLDLIKGRMSEHHILQVHVQAVVGGESQSAIQNDDGGIAVGSSQSIHTLFTQELCLYQSEMTKQKQTQQVSSIVVKVPEEQTDALDKVLAYVISIERIYGTDNFVIRITEVIKYDSMTMSSFRFDPMASPNFGSLGHQEQTLFLIMKNNRKYVRLTYYEVLNTELRSLLFKHSYGYDLALVDFGKLSALQSTSLKLREPVKLQIESELMKSTAVSGMKFIYRDFGIIRIKTLTITLKETPNKYINERNHEEDGDEMQRDAQQIEAMGGEDDEPFTIENHYTIFAFYDDYKCLNHGEIFLQLQIDGIFTELTEKISGVDELLKVDPEDLSTLIMGSKEKVCKQIFDQLVIMKIVTQSAEEGVKIRYRVVIDPKMQPMNEVIELLKQEKFKQQIDENDIIDHEFQEAKQLGITLNLLAECQKNTQVSIINRKVFKVTCYFVNNLKSIKLQPLPQRVFNWQVVYVEAETRLSTKSFIIAVTEKDIIEMVEQVMEKQHAGMMLIKEIKQIVYSRAPITKIVEFILDSIVIDEENQSLKISITHLMGRMHDRILLKKYFHLTGGRYLPSLQGNSGFFDDQEMSVFKTSLPQIEMVKKLVVNIEREFSERKYDIKIFEVQVKHATGQTKYQFEMFAVDHPEVIFRADFLSEAYQAGKKLLVERFNVIQQLHQDFEEGKFLKDGMVISILEQGFPHQITFMVLEPISHIQWFYQINDDKPNQIENRQEKEYFVKACKQALEKGLWFDQVISYDGLPPAPQDIVVELTKAGYQKSIDTYEHQDTVELWQGSLNRLLKESQSDIVYQREMEIIEDSDIYANIALIYDKDYNSLKLQVSKIGEATFIVDCSRESSRFLSGMLPVTDKIKVYYSIETCCGYTEQERAFRIVVKEPKADKKLIDLILSENYIINMRMETGIHGNKFKVFGLKEEVKYAFNTGFKDSFALFQKMPEMITDFKQAFIVNEDRLRFQPPPDNSKLLHRKVVNLAGMQTFIIYVKCDSMERLLQQFKVILFEQASGYEEEFLFITQRILTKEEYLTIKRACQTENEKLARESFSKIVEKRLKIKQMGEDMQMVTPIKSPQDRYIAYFLEASSLVEQPALGLKNKDHTFDIRNGFRFALTDPEQVLPESEYILQQRMIAQLEKDDILFDVTEVLNPFSMIIRIKTFDKESLTVLCVSDISEAELKEQLMNDQVSYLLAEPHRRDELAKYIVQNVYYDEVKKRVFFLRSSIAGSPRGGNTSTHSA